MRAGWVEPMAPAGVATAAVPARAAPAISVVVRLRIRMLVDLRWGSGWSPGLVGHDVFGTKYGS